MAFTKRLEFGNYTLTFGDKKVMLDLFEEIVAPTFSPQKYSRKIEGKGEYFFLESKTTIITDNSGQKHPAIIGKIVKNTKIKREQIFQNNNIILDKKELETAPTSIFVLLLENHRLIFCREVSGAPSIQNFASTSLNFLQKRHEEFIKQKLEEAQPSAESPPPRGTKANLVREYPHPKLRITPLSDRQSLEDFIDRFKTIDQITIKLLPKSTYRNFPSSLQEQGFDTFYSRGDGTWP